MSATTAFDARSRPARTRRVLGFDFLDDVDVLATVERLLGPQAGEAGEPVVFTPNVDTIVRLGELERNGFADRLRDARYILPDGQPIVWLSRLVDEPLRARLTGSDLVPPLWQRIAADGRRAMIVASSEPVAEALRAELPSVGAYVPPFFDEADPDEVAAVVRSASEVIDRVDPEFVFLGISFPRREVLALELIDHLRRQGRPLPVFLLIGGGMEMYLGMVKRAPTWVQRMGVEWFYRFLHEPRRLFRRYFVEDARFVSIAAQELQAARRRRATSGSRPASADLHGEDIHAADIGIAGSPAVDQRAALLESHPA